MIVLGLDLGTKRIGVAKTDELNMFAHPVGYLSRGVGNQDLIDVVKLLIEKYKPGKIVVGLPKKLDGSTGPAEIKAQKEIELLEKSFSIEIIAWDERLTTKEASRYMQDVNVSGKKKRKKIDSLAAQIMLQGYLDYNKFN